MIIRSYKKEDEDRLFQLIRGEGSDWDCYSAPGSMDRYRKAVENSITYVAYEGETLCGYLRAVDDFGMDIYIYDLLVSKQFRGQELGRKLMEQVCIDHPQRDVYVMSGVDGYYTKVGYERAGSIYVVKIK